MKFDVIDAPADRRYLRGKYSEVFDAIANLPPGKCVSISSSEAGVKSAAGLQTYIYAASARLGIGVSTRIDGDTLLIFKKGPPLSRA